MNKKGIYALEQLIGIIISSIVIIMLFIYFILPFFFTTSSNLNIAKSNADSIKNFIDTSMDTKYNNLKDCFTVLKIVNLENFQSVKSHGNLDNYFYVIDSSRVYVVSFDYIDKIDDKNVNDVIKFSKYKTKEFKNNKKVDIFVDETNQGSRISTSIDIIPFVGFNIGNADKQLNLEKRGDLIILYPIIGDGSYLKDRAKEILFEDYSSNKLGSMIFDKDGFIPASLGGASAGYTQPTSTNLKTINGDKLVFKPENQALFLPIGKMSEMLVDNNLCSFMYLNKQDIKDYYTKNIDKIPLSNMKIVLTFEFEDYKKSDYSFEYIGNEARCFYKDKLGCEDNLNEDEKKLLENVEKSRSVDEFKNNVQKFYENIIKETGTMKIEAFELTNAEIKNLNINVKFDDVFEKLEGYEKGFSDEDKENFIFHAENILNWNKNINGARTDDANYIIYLNAKAYFYVKKSNENSKEVEYYSFNQDWLYKIENSEGNFDFYFLNKKIEIERRELNIEKASKWWKNLPFLKDDQAFYFIEINDIEGKKYDVILSPVQITKIITK